MEVNYNFRFFLFIIDVIKTTISSQPKTINVHLYQITATSNHQITSQITFARLSSILRGADDAFESISFKLSLLAYTWLYSSEKSHWDKGIAAAYQKLFIIHKISTAQKVVKAQKRKIEIQEIRTQKSITGKVQIFFDTQINGICAQ